MLSVLGRSRRTCQGLSRRRLLEIGGAGLFGLSLPKLWAAESAAQPRPARATSVLFVFLYGGPSQHETFDMKPDAPEHIRGPYRPIASRTSGLRICEHLPRLAARSDRYCVIRTVGHTQNDHNGTHYIQTGHPLPPAQRGAENVDATDKDWPSFGSVVEYLDEHDQSKTHDFPSYVYLPKRLGHFAGYNLNGQYAGWLGHAYDGVATNISKRSYNDNPYFRDCTDEELDFRIRGFEPAPEITLERFDRRRSLLEQFDASRRDLEQASRIRDFSELRSRALNLMTSKEIGEAFDIRREPDKLRDQYGRNLFGQSLIMGRRMIEAGARFVTVAWDLAVRGDGMGSWDMHNGLERVMKNHLLPGFDQGFAALLDDMSERGLLDETLVIVVGEMGRTPRYLDGRGHWSYCFPCVLAGAGVRGGMTYGRSDKDAAWPLEHAVNPEDLACTIYDALGIDPHAHLLRDIQGRPVALVDGGSPLDQLVG